MRSRSFRLWPVVSLILLILASSTHAQADLPKIERNIVYVARGDEELKLDLCKPAVAPGAKGEPRPVVVCIHGGAWLAGNRADQHRNMIRLAKEGFTTVSVTYRLAPKHPYPAALDDVKAALRFVRAKAKDWNIDPERVAVLGESAGGHLALLAGVTPGDADTKVRAVVNYFGPTDFATWRPTFPGEIALLLGVKRNSSDIMKAFLGTSDRDAEIVKRSSPITHATKERAKECPPILTVQGTADPLVPDQQARLLHKALDAAGIPNQLELIDGAGHGWGGAQRERTDRKDVEFLKKHLAK